MALPVFLSYFASARPPAHVLAPDFPSTGSTINGKRYPAAELWFNSEPLNWEKLKNKVVLIDFWEYTCINCIRTFDYLKKWDKLYRSDGLVIIGVHTPEFDFAHDPANVKQAVRRFGFEFPVVVDSDMRIWSSYAVNAWPTKILVGPDRRIVFTHVGEGGYAEFEEHIREALSALHPGLKFTQPIEPDKTAEGGFCGDTTPEVYTGTARGGVLTGTSKAPDGTPYVSGSWRAEPDAQRAETPLTKDSFLGMRYHGSEIFSVLNQEGTSPVSVRVEQDGKPLSKERVGEDVRFDARGNSYFDVTEHRMYYLVKNPDNDEHEIRLYPQSPGLGVYSFTFSNRCLLRYSHL
jgi:thiol-disulfide isomerase/thioredoxin